jgi:CheY-like chemotaxis protein
MAHILVIDDEELSLFTMREILEEAGHTVVTAGDGMAGLALQGAQAFDLVITDMVMPHKEGVQLIVEIRERDSRIPILAISGSGRSRNTDFLELARQRGANAVLTKPFSEEDLLNALAVCLETDG